DFRNENEHSPVAILRGLASSHLYVQQMLLFAPARSVTALIARPFAAGTAHFHCAPFRRARDNSIMRRQSSSYLIPAAAAASGSRLASVIPGIVFTSKTLGSAFSGKSTSTRE